MSALKHVWLSAAAYTVLFVILVFAFSTGDNGHVGFAIVLTPAVFMFMFVISGLAMALTQSVQNTSVRTAIIYSAPLVTILIRELVV